MHVVLRGVAAQGNSLRLSREYIKHGVREIAEELCTCQLGFRTSLDAAEAERREVNEVRITSLDRMILRRARQTEHGLLFHPTVGSELQPNVMARLFRLQQMELAQRHPDGSWLVKQDTSQILGAMQRTTDHQRVLTMHGALLSDSRLGIEVINWKNTQSVEGRILVHGQNEQSGKSYLMLEATTGRVFYIPYTREIEEVRSRGGLKTNALVRLRRIFADRQPSMEVRDYGDAEGALKNRRLLREKIHDMQTTGAAMTEDGWGGWLGRYQHAVSVEAEMPIKDRVRGCVDLKKRSESVER